MHRPSVTSTSVITGSPACVGDDNRVRFAMLKSALARASMRADKEASRALDRGERGQHSLRACRRRAFAGAAARAERQARELGGHRARAEARLSHLAL